ncbi:acetolactate decarboxylase [Nonomuraea sp. NPDC004186]|uniref:acetolactate decarboxylase n=1 Tax=Nonomuraea sp. NPDC049625 TaxID=3155775 RepID=UPI00343DC7A8
MNLIHAIRVTGTFAQVRTRTVMAQTPPYPPLTDATADEPVTRFTDVAGTLAGYRTPDYEQGISVAGYHLHFIDDQHAHGGHSLDFELAYGEIAVSSSADLHLSLPRSEAFLAANLSPTDIAAQIRQSEGG